MRTRAAKQCGFLENCGEGGYGRTKFTARGAFHQQPESTTLTFCHLRAAPAKKVLRKWRFNNEMPGKHVCAMFEASSNCNSVWPTMTSVNLPQIRSFVIVNLGPEMVSAAYCFFAGWLNYVALLFPRLVYYYLRGGGGGGGVLAIIRHRPGSSRSLWHYPAVSQLSFRHQHKLYLPSCPASEFLKQKKMPSGKYIQFEHV